MKLLEKTRITCQISLEDFHGGMLRLWCSPVPLHSLIRVTEMRWFGKNSSQEYLTFACIPKKTGENFPC